MSTIKVFSLLEGTISPQFLEVELNAHLNIPSLHFVGLPNTEINESKIRVESAFLASELKFPLKKIVVNFVPADLKKCGTHLDLPIALAILLSDLSDKVQPHSYSFFAVGELSLSGSLRSYPKKLRALSAALQAKASYFICLEEEYEEYIQYSQRYFQNDHETKIRFIRINSLKELKEKIHFILLHPEKYFKSFSPQTFPSKLNKNLDTSLREMKIPPFIHKMICLSLGGHHHLLISGPKGQGKSYALQCIEKIATQLSDETPLEALYIQEMTTLHQTPYFPIRKVGSHVRPASLLGKTVGDSVYPGEFSKAHCGVFVADEFLEWPRDALESFREPLETGKVFLSRGRNTFELPASFILVASANECPCGGFQNERVNRWGDPCTCGSKDIIKYRSKLSGPIKDRITLNAQWNGEDPNLKEKISLETTSSIVKKMRHTQLERYGKLTGLLQSHEITDLESNHPEWQDFQDQLVFSNYRKKIQTTRLALTLQTFYGNEKLDFTDFEEADRLLSNRDKIL